MFSVIKPFSNLRYGLRWLCVVSLWLYSCENSSVETVQEAVVQSPKSEIDILTDQISKDRLNSDLFHRRAIAYIKIGSLDAAMNSVKIAIGIDSTKGEYFFTKAEIHFAYRKVIQSIDALERCVNLEAEHIEALVKLAELEFYIKNVQKSISYLKKVNEVDPYNAQAYYIHGLVFKQIGDTTKALGSLQTAVEYDPDHYDAYLQLGLIHYGLNEKISEHYLKSAINLAPESTEALYALAMFYQSFDDTKKAMDMYYNIIELDVRYINAHYNLGYLVYEELRDNETALKHFDNALSCDSTHANSQYMKGLIHEELMKYPEARKYYIKALKFETNHELAIKGMNRLDRAPR
ncbi:MAG: hypothetical protein COB85_05185 [Bacteroidetes bacterium]|nr:MAG: hypothetical protein COB85_05185 [Bacteroidota bacterium]